MSGVEIAKFHKQGSKQSKDNWGDRIEGESGWTGSHFAWKLLVRISGDPIIVEKTQV